MTTLYDLRILLENVQLNIRRVMWYQHGCSAHYGHKVRATLNETFLRWTRWTSFIASSPDITLDYFFTLKNIVYQERLHQKI